MLLFVIAAVVRFVAIKLRWMKQNRRRGACQTTRLLLKVVRLPAKQFDDYNGRILGVIISITLSFPGCPSIWNWQVLPVCVASYPHCHPTPFQRFPNRHRPAAAPHCIDPFSPKWQEDWGQTMNHSSEDLLLITFVKNSKGQQKFEWKIVGLVAEISMGGEKLPRKLPLMVV